MEAGDYLDRIATRRVSVLVDDDGAAEQMTQLGFGAARFDDHDFSEPSEQPAFVVITRPSSIERLHALWGASAQVVGYLALAKFDGSLESLRYSLARLLSTDLTGALSRRTETYDGILSCQDIEVATGGGILRCHMRDELEIPNPGSVMEPGSIYSLAEFFEASVVNLESERSSFWVEGELAVDGLIHLHNTSDLKARFVAPLDALMRRAARGRGAVRFTDNKLDRLILEGEDVTGPFLELMTGEERGVAATELGFGCARVAAPEDWTINAVLHKTGVGAYVGIGAGLHVPHVDFIVRDAEIRFLRPVEEQESGGAA